MADLPRFSATVHGVRDVSLLGRADLEFWAARLDPLGLEPIERDGAAQVMILAADLRWGIRFRELTLSIAATHRSAGRDRLPEAVLADGFFFAQAFSTSRFFSWCERRFFRTPYLTAEIALELDRPSFSADLGGETVLSVERGERAGGWEPAHDRDWIGAAFLPPPPGARATARCLVGKVAGKGEISPFLPETDRCELSKAEQVPVLADLLDSRFEPKEWLVRRDATHARTKTLVLPDRPR